MDQKSIWITWERQRRSLELAKALQAIIHILLPPDFFQGLLRYPYLSIRTLLIVIKEAPDVVFVQNPSIVLTALLTAFKNLFSYKLVVDRHSNFKFDTIKSKRLKWKFFHYLSRYTIKNAELTIVTNDYLFDIVNKWGGHGFILQDKLPELAIGERIDLGGKKNIVVISTFAEDEPIIELLNVAKKLSEDCFFYITGSYDRYKKKYLLDNLPVNIKPTGFLPEKMYQSLLISADLIVVLTKGEHVLNCGAYEAISLSQPLVLSDTKAIRNYFRKGVVFSKCDSNSIAAAITEGIRNNDFLKKEIVILKDEISNDWREKFNHLKKIVYTFFI